MKQTSEAREALDTLREVGNEIYAAGVCGESAQKWWGAAVRDAGDVLERAWQKSEGG